MKKVIIYQDNEQKVTMPLSCASYLNALFNTQFRLSTAAAEQILNMSLEVLEQKDKISKGIKIISSTKVPIVNRGQFFETATGYEDLMPAIITIFDFFDSTIGELTDDEKEELSFLIEQFYEENYGQYCMLYFFPEEIYNVTATLSLVLDNKLLVLPLTFNETDELKIWY